MTDRVIPVDDYALDAQDRERIVDFADKVVRFGEDFELKVAQKETANPLFAFLRSPGIQSDYYRWKLFCIAQAYSAEDIHQLVKNFGVYIMENCSNDRSLDLTDKDRASLFMLLVKNDGSKQHIQELRMFIVERSHSFLAIGRIFLSYLSTVSPSRFQHVLHTLFVLNDVIFHSKDLTMRGNYTSAVEECGQIPVEFLKAIWQSMVQIMARCAALAKDSAPGDEGAASASGMKLRKLAELWQLKGHISSEQLSEINCAMDGMLLRYEDSGGLSPLVSPYCPVSILPASRAPALTTLAFGGQASSADHPAAAAAPAPPVIPPSAALNMLQVRVGRMVNIVKEARRLNPELEERSYCPIDVSLLPPALNPYVEPGRLEARMANFSDKLNLLMNPKLAESAAITASATGPNARLQQREHNADYRWERDAEDFVSGTLDSKKTYLASYRQARMEAVEAQKVDKAGERALPADNIGRSLLAGLGWEEGCGLGAAGAGRQTPIDAVPKLGKGGIGSGRS
jgi:hypothetical protein